MLSRHQFKGIRHSLPLRIINNVRCGYPDDESLRPTFPLNKCPFFFIFISLFHDHFSVNNLWSPRSTFYNSFWKKHLWLVCCTNHLQYIGVDLAHYMSVKHFVRPIPLPLQCFSYILGHIYLFRLNASM